MQRVKVPHRQGWMEANAAIGFSWQGGQGDEPEWWCEGAAYCLDRQAVERQLVPATATAGIMMLDAVGEVMRSRAALLRCGVPEHAHEAVRRSWERADPELIGRFDFSWSGRIDEVPRLIEYNGSPGAIFEAAVVQWLWFEEMRRAGHLPPGTDQFNRLHASLMDRFRLLSDGTPWHFTAFKDVAEDVGDETYLMDLAIQSGIEVHWLPEGEVRIDEAGQFIGLDDEVIDTWHRLASTNWLLDEMREDMAALQLPSARMVEPLWKAVASSKGLLPVLWRLFPDHPMVLPATYADEEGEVGRLFGTAGFALKTMLGREGDGVVLLPPGSAVSPGQEPSVAQALAPLPRFRTSEGEVHALVGSWFSAGEACGISIREDRSAVTGGGARFVPHFLA